MTTRSLGHRLRRMGAAVAIVASTTAISVAVGGGTAHAAEPFSCATSTVFLPLSEPDELTQLYTGTYGAGEMTLAPLGTPTHRWNATGYNPNDGYLYGYQNQDGGRLLQIGADGSVTDLGAVGAPGDSFNSGDFDDNGTFWISRPNRDTLLGIDVTTRATTELALSGTAQAADMVYAHGFMWSVNRNTHVLQRINLNNGNIRQYPLPGMEDTGVVGAAFAYGNGDLGFLAQGSGTLYRVRITNPGGNVQAAVVGTQRAIASGGADGAACVGVPVDLAVTVAAPAVVAPGGRIDYTLTVANVGSTDSSGWTLTGALPPGLLGATTSTPGCEITTGAISCTGGALNAGASTQIALTGSGPDSGSVVVSASVDSNEDDTNPANDNASAETTIEIPVQPVDLGLTVQAPEAVAPGDPIDYRLDVTNTGPGDSTGWSVIVEVPAHLSNLRTSTAGCELSGTTLTCTGGPLGSGQTAPIAFTGDAPADGNVVVPGTVTGNEEDSNSANDSDSAQTEVVPVPGAPMVSGQAIGAIGGGAMLLFGLGWLVRRQRRSSASVTAA